MRVAILGGGAGGASAAIELTQHGHEVRLWNRGAAGLAPFIAAGGIRHTGVLGDGLTRIAGFATDPAVAVRGADVLLVCLPTLAHAGLARTLIEVNTVDTPVILNPGHTGGALEFSAEFRRRGLQPPPVAEFSTLTYVARVRAEGLVATTGRAKRVRAAALPGAGAALKLATSLYDCAQPVENVLVTSLANVNMVLHPPGAVLGAAWVEATGGDFTFYVQGLTEGVARVMERLDLERRQVARGFGIELPSLFEEMRAIGTIDASVPAGAGLANAIRAGTANRAIKAPASLAHRYYQEDLWYGLGPFLALAQIAEVEAPCAQALLELGECAAGAYAPSGRRRAAEMGISGLDKNALLAFVTERVRA
jgi:opine dehydrogenase